MIQVKSLGFNFFLISFDSTANRDAALSHAPWFMYKRFVFIAEWKPEFDIRKDFDKFIPIWMEIPYRALVLKDNRRDLMLRMGPLLHFAQGEDVTSYPHDRACILWDTTKEVPKRLRIWVDDDNYVWQTVIFKNLPTMCKFCNSSRHLAFDCPSNK